jgi:AAA ATPase domain
MSGLTSLEVGSFKAFDRTQSIPVRPLTLLFGPNSAGKSSIIHALAYLNEAAASRNLDVRHPRVGGTAVDLGGFPSFVHRRSAAGRCEFGLEFAGQRLPDSLTRLLVRSPESLKVTFTVGGMHTEKRQLALWDLAGVGVGRNVVVTSLLLEVDGHISLRLSRRPDGSLRVDALGRQWNLARALEPAQRKALTKAEHEPMWAFVDGHVASLRVLGDGLCPNEVQMGQRSGAISNGKRPSRFETGLVHLVQAITDELSRLIQAEFQALKYLGPLRSFPARHVYEPRTGDPDWLAGGAFAWHLLAQDEVLREKLNRWLGQKALQTRYELTVQAFASLDEIREPLLSHLQSLNEGNDEEVPPRDDGEKEATGDDESDWKLDEALLAIREASSGLLTSVGLRDLRTRTMVSHRDVGIGISQVLPVLALAYGASSSLVAIEQPELHLHPALQSELGDVFIESALIQGNTLILETHSEHLILRLLRRIREASLGAGKGPRLLPEHVAVLYVEPTSGGAQVTEIPVRADGEFDAPWPQGFFAERMKELL